MLLVGSLIITTPQIYQYYKLVQSTQGDYKVMTSGEEIPSKPNESSTSMGKDVTSSLTLKRCSSMGTKIVAPDEWSVFELTEPSGTEVCIIGDGVSPTNKAFVSGVLFFKTDTLDYPIDQLRDLYLESAMKLGKTSQYSANVSKGGTQLFRQYSGSVSRTNDAGYMVVERRDELFDEVGGVWYSVRVIVHQSDADRYNQLIEQIIQSYEIISS